jgi:hypothetical protein
MRKTFLKFPKTTAFLFGATALISSLSLMLLFMYLKFSSALFYLGVPSLFFYLTGLKLGQLFPNEWIVDLGCFFQGSPILLTLFVIYFIMSGKISGEGALIIIIYPLFYLIMLILSIAGIIKGMKQGKHLA